MSLLILQSNQKKINKEKKKGKHHNQLIHRFFIRSITKSYPINPINFETAIGVL